jgi:3-dehydroquinate synthase
MTDDLRIAVIPAAGRGARLDRPNTPKPLVDVGGKSLILNILGRLEKAGIDKAIVLTGYEGKRVARELTNHPDLGIDVRCVRAKAWERGLASTVYAAREHVDEPFVLAMADHIFEQSTVDAFLAPGKGEARMLVDTNVDRVYAIDDAVKVALDADDVEQCGRDLVTFDAVDAGLFALPTDFFATLETVLDDHEEAGLSRAVTAYAEQDGVCAHPIGGATWHDIDTPPSLIRAEMDYRKRRRRETVTGPKFGEEATSPSYEYAFTTGKPIETDVLVQRGFVRDPTQFQLIPDESASSPIYVFTDTKVNRLYGDDFVEGLESLGYDIRRVVMAEGEESKTLSNYTRLVEHVLAEGIDERSVLISLGGGAVCNVCGFIASTLYRGIGLVHVPTTLMAQCDAAISHKQGVNGERGKNLVGAYYPPIRIAVDVDVLQTLEDWLIPDGMAEVVKHALGQDKGYLDYLMDYDGSMWNPDFLEHVVRKNIELKCELMAVDPKELREGLVLQYGHEVGHPVEYLSGYDINHGQSIGIGMMVSARVARLVGACDEGMVELHRELIEKYELPTSIPRSIKVDDIMATTRYNKRYLTEGTRMALVDEPGNIWSVDDDYAIPVSDEVLREAISASYE